MNIDSINMSFIGDYICKLDQKGRFILPAGFRKHLSAEETRLVVKRDIYENCLVIYSEKEWNRQVETIREKINPYNKDHARFLRTFYRSASELTIDGNGRVLLPKRLLEQVGIEKSIVLIGVDDKIEVWSEDTYENGSCEEQEFEDLASSILGGTE